MVKNESSTPGTIDYGEPLSAEEQRRNNPLGKAMTEDEPPFSTVVVWFMALLLGGFGVVLFFNGMLF